MADDCGLLNLATCLPQKLFDFFLGIFNAPLQPLLSFTKTLLTSPIDLGLFASLWGIMIYIISLFYGLLLLYSGFNFMISGYDVVKREKAKEWLRNIFIMIVLVQASYFIYGLILDINSLLTIGIINLIDNDFFLLSADNIVNIGLQFLFAIFYVLALLMAVIILMIRYVVVAVGVVFVPLAIFLYFIPPLKEYGKLIMNYLGVCIFLTFFDAVILLACSKLIDVGIFDNFKILVMITAFSIVNLLMGYLMVFTLVNTGLKSSGKILG
ncbi:hypothetical protein J4227_07180 [Candidatus Woesearchaeota archaeon]|nr:hypothetical protein [Candidatus Woesearchaeota archaeon]